MPPKGKRTKKGGDVIDDIGRVANIGMQVGMPIAHLLMGMGCHIHRLEKHMKLPHHMPGVDGKHGSGILGDVLGVIGMGDEVAGADDCAGDDDVAGSYQTGGNRGMNGNDGADEYANSGVRHKQVKNLSGQQELEMVKKGNTKTQRVLTLQDLKPDQW